MCAVMLMVKSTDGQLNTFSIHNHACYLLFVLVSML